MRGLALFIGIFALGACGGSVDLSAIPEQADAPPYFSVAGEQKIKIVGSSTVAPFSTTVAEQFGAASPYPTPIVESTGTGGGFKAFCKAIGPNEPSISNASRKIKDAGPDFDLTKKQLYLALAAELPNGEGGWVKNPHKRWSDIDPALPSIRIIVSGPPPTSGTRDAFAEIAMAGGAMSVPEVLALKDTDPAAFTRRAHDVRNDGAWIDSGENDSSIINTLLRNEDAIGVLGYSFLEQNLDRVKGAKIGGVAPVFEDISNGTYGISRSMYFYVKRENLPLVSGLADYVREFTQEDAWGPDGYLIEKGLIPLLEADRLAGRAEALRALKTE